MHLHRCTLTAVVPLAVALLATPATSADARSLRSRMATALSRDGITSEEIADGTIRCADLSAEVLPGVCPDPDAPPPPAAQNVFVDGFTQTDKDLPSTPSGNDPAATIASLTLDEGSWVIFASIVWSGSPLDFSGIVTCHLVPPNGPNAKAEFIGTGTTTGTLFVQTTSVGGGVVDFRCSDQSAGSTVKYRFLQLTAIPAPGLTAVKLQ
jgi:hypothetical protein